ncbi:hypothetical protein TcWFU_009543 [Taenia crassiceps]|uniref:Ubiquitin-like domain-containing protein n=1 Tax=Taenia crassiceps TaxID=6207 RepID=A0ABR4QU82_9CEST
MHIEVEHLDSTILSLKADKEFTVENLKHVVSQNIHIPASDLTLASNGSLLEDGHRFSERTKAKTKKGDQSYLNLEPMKIMNKEASPIKNGSEASQFSQRSSSSKKVGELESFSKYQMFENPLDDTIRSSLPCATPLPPAPSPPLFLEQTKADSVENPNNNAVLTTDSSVPSKITEQSSMWNAAASLTDHQSQNSSPNLRNDSESLRSWPVPVESKTIAIPGRFRQHQTKPVLSGQFHSKTGMSERRKSTDRMDIIFTDGIRKMTVELPITATVVEGLEAVKTRISDSDKDRLRLFKGYVQMEAHHSLSQYGVVNGSTVVFKKPGPVQKF